MLNAKYQRYADRIRELIEEGRGLFKDLHKSQYQGDYISNPIAVEAWHAKTRNIIETVFGKKSAHYQQYTGFTIKLNTGNSAYTINQIIGLLTGALDDLENGFLQGQEFIIAGEVFDSVLEQARHLNFAGYKDPAAVLGRVVLEDALKRLAREESIDDNQKASAINDALKENGKYSKPQWRRIQAMTDIGNDAAHGKFETFTKDDVVNMINDIERFIASYFGV